MSTNRLSKDALRGIEEARLGNTTLALALLEGAMTEFNHARVKAWYGYSLAREGKDMARAHQLCQDAIRQNPDDADSYLALGRLYLFGKRRKLAILVLEKGLALGRHDGISRLLESIGMRKRPVLPFLGRDNPLNVSSGKLLARWGVR